jgi:hypothetical protein
MYFKPMETLLTMKKWRKRTVLNKLQGPAPEADLLNSFLGWDKGKV